MDEKDVKILRAIAREGITSPDKIETHTEIPKSTVHYRLERLREEGVVESDLMEMDLTKLGISITILSEVYAEYGEGYHEEVGERLAELEGVNQVYFTMGDTDFVVVAHLPNRKMVESLIESYEAIDQVRRTSSRFVITTVKNETHPINDFDLETLVTGLGED